MAVRHEFDELEGTRADRLELPSWLRSLFAGNYYDRNCVGGEVFEERRLGLVEGNSNRLGVWRFPAFDDIECRSVYSKLPIPVERGHHVGGC
jgi:hypothetical protein